MIERHLGELTERGMSSSSVAITVRVARSFFAHLEREGAVFVSPAAGLRTPKRKRGLGPVLTEEEARLLLAAPDVSTVFGLRDRALLEVMYGTGARLEEATTLRLDDLDMDGGTIRLTGKGRKERAVPLGRHAVWWIEAYVRNARPWFLRGRRDAGALWYGVFKTPLTTCGVAQLVAKNAKRAGIRAEARGCHAVRRACATHMLRRGAHPAMVAEMLGHSGLHSLGHYLRVSIADLKKAHAGSKVGR
jgi:integrase/recombinase XerD